MDDKSNTMDNRTAPENPVQSGRYDYLTGLPSMTWFFELADAGKEEVLKHGGRPALVYMNFNGMKYYNMHHGFAEGDKLLQDFAGLLIETFNTEHCSRFGADHFVIYTEEAGLEDKLDQLFHDWDIMKHGSPLPLHAGIYLRQNEYIHISVACDRAKAACNSLGERYESAYCYYNLVQKDDDEKKRHVIESFDQAIAEKWIRVHYQPIVRTVNEKICNEESLSRWIDPERGYLSPVEFIPALEDAGIIYKLDLYVLEEILKKIKTQAEYGLAVVPHSLNLSRSDFSCCDIVEEIRKRVDAAGIGRSQIAIEITESVIGSDFEYMKRQVERFRELGFPVWMDDFGSGYSSLDVLQSIQFDLIKFDLSFMQKLNEGSGRIILTELMKMATALGVDTVCEGVETEDHMRFLREIGCSKLQGYYFGKAISLDEIIEKSRQENHVGYENAEEASYYETISRVNLYDFSVISNEGGNDLQNFFNTLPMGIVEINGDYTRFVRSNQSYRDFIKRFFGFNLSYEGTEFTKFDTSFLINILENTKVQKTRSLFNEKMPDGTLVHSIARVLDVNPVNGNIAVAVAVLSIMDAEESTTYADIARALAAAYYKIYYVDLDTEKFIEYSPNPNKEELAVERHGENFFEGSRNIAINRVYEPDRPRFLSTFTKENIIKALDEHGVFTASFRVVDTGVPMRVSLKITRLHPGTQKVILGISIVDPHESMSEDL